MLPSDAAALLLHPSCNLLLLELGRPAARTSIHQSNRVTCRAQFNFAIVTSFVDLVAFMYICTYFPFALQYTKAKCTSSVSWSLGHKSSGAASAAVALLHAAPKCHLTFGFV